MVTGRTNNDFNFPPDMAPEGVLALVERNFSTANPNIGKIQSCIIRSGPIAYRFAVMHEVIDQHTKEHHHNALTLYSYKKKREGWIEQEERRIILDDHETDEIGILEHFIAQYRTYIYNEKKVYGIIEASDFEKFSTISKSGVGDIIREILEDGDNYQRIVQEGGLGLMKDMIDWAFSQNNTKTIVEQLNTLDADSLKELTTVAGISQINKILEIWNANQENCSEEFWQKTLSDYSWIVSQLFAVPVILYKEKAYVGGKTLDNTGGNLVDYIYKNNLSYNTAIVEIKTPCTKIIGRQYRQTFSMSDETSGAISQALNYKHQLQKNYISLQYAQKSDAFEALNPKTLLIIGNLQKELSGDSDKLEAFELFRHNLNDVSILTYDELFSKVELLKTILQRGR